MNKNQYAGLLDPKLFNDPIDINGCKHEQLLGFYKKMVEIRSCEEEIADLIRSGHAVCPCHLATGQEAIATGISISLRKTDRIFGNHRSHAHFIALGGSPRRLFAEILGKVTGCSKGMGGSMHLHDSSIGFYGAVPIVGGTIPLAVGAALAAKMDGGNDIAVCYFGDGASEEGVFHESMNLAAIYNLPILFVCENNLYSSHLDIRQRQPSEFISRFAEAHSIPFEIIDGNNVVKAGIHAENIISKIRKGQGPAFLEAITFRWLGHVGPNDDIDVGVRRSKAELALWKKRDPIRRLEDSLINDRVINKSGLDKIKHGINKSIKADIVKALNDPYPEESALMDLVYKNR